MHFKKKKSVWKDEERDRKIKEAEDEAVAIVQVTGDTRMGWCTVALKKQTDLRNGNKGKSTGYREREQRITHSWGVGEAPFTKMGDVERGQLHPTSS